MAVGIAMAAISAAQAIYGMSQQEDAKKNLGQLGDRPQYEVTPQQLNSYNRAEQNSRYGYSPTERAAYEQDMSRSQNTAYQKAIDMGGGNLAGAIRAALGYSNLHAKNRFAADDARLHRQNIRYADERGDVISRQDNLMTSGDQQTYDQIARAYGAEGQAGTKNLFSGLYGAGAGFADYYDNTQNGAGGGGAPAAAGGGATPPLYNDQGPYSSPPPSNYGSPSIYRQMGPQDQYSGPYQPANNPQVDTPDMFNFAHDYYSSRSQNPPFEESTY